MNLQSLPTPRFVRRTSLGPNEYRKNFRQIDREVIDAVTSREADRVTPLMSKIYLRLVNAPAQYWEREGVLRFVAELREDGCVKAWEALCELLGVASATASKALRWMHEQGIIGYFAGKNGVGLRIFLNRASSSVGTRSGGEKILEFRHTSSKAARASRDEAAFSDSFADLESLEKNLLPLAPKNGADNTGAIKSPPTQIRPEQFSTRPVATETTVMASAEGFTELLLGKLEPAMRTAAAQAAAREHERTREWLESRGLPKAVRVAQQEVFNVLRRQGLVGTDTVRKRFGARVGGRQHEPTEARRLLREEVRELAETCIAMLEVHGKPIDVTLAELGTEAGGVLLAEDAPKVRELAKALARGEGKEGRVVV